MFRASRPPCVQSARSWTLLPVLASSFRNPASSRRRSTRAAQQGHENALAVDRIPIAVAVERRRLRPRRTRRDRLRLRTCPVGNLPSERSGKTSQKSSPSANGRPFRQERVPSGTQGKPACQAILPTRAIPVRRARPAPGLSGTLSMADARPVGSPVSSRGSQVPQGRHALRTDDPQPSYPRCIFQSAASVSAGPQTCHSRPRRRRSAMHE